MTALALPSASLKLFLVDNPVPSSLQRIKTANQFWAACAVPFDRRNEFVSYTGDVKQPCKEEGPIVAP